jgi:DNA-binding beta-propeller fold protein YncE
MLNNKYRLSLLVILLIFLLIPQKSSALSDGILASDSIGQYDQTNFSDPVSVYTKSGADDSANRFGFSSPRQGLFDTTNDRFFLTDTSNNRILVFNLNANDTFIDKIPDYVLGQPNFYTNTAATTQSGMSSPSALAYDATDNLLFVVDQGNNRVVVFDVASITNGENAINVLGQSDFTTATANVTQSGMSNPTSLAYDSADNLLFVSQGTARRVTVFNVASITDGEDAVNVLGQADFTSSVSAQQTSTGLNQPRGIAYDSDNQRLFVGQQSGRRVSVFNLADGLTDNEAAVNVLGQVDFTTNTSTASQIGHAAVWGVTYDSVHQRLFVNNDQSTGNRILVYNVSSITDGENATNVLGQANFTATTIATTQSGVNLPLWTTYDSTNDKLFVSDSTNNRILIFDTASITDGENAVDAMGQYDQTSFTTPVPVYTKSGANDSPNRFGFNQPQYMALDTVHHRMFVSDTTNKRVLVYDLASDNTFDDKVADYVLGQPNFYSNSAALTASGMTSPVGLIYDSVNDRLFVADSSYHRITVYDVSSITNGESAVNVIGQTVFTANSSGSTQSTLLSTREMAYDSANYRLFVTEPTASRVKVFNVDPAVLIANNTSTDGPNAINVLGQTNFTNNSLANTQSGMNFPRGLEYDPTTKRLYVAEQNGNRVKVFNVDPAVLIANDALTDGPNAISILGQTLFTTATAATTAGGMSAPQSVAYDSSTDRLFVSDSAGSRVLIFNIASITDGEAAVNVLGQADFTTSSTATTQSGLNLPRGLLYDDVHNWLYVAEQGNNRIMKFDLTDLSVTSVSSPVPGVYYPGDVVTITVTFSNAVTVTGTPLLNLETGTTDRNASYTSGSGTNVLTFTYTVQAGDSSSDLDYTSTSALSLNGGTIIDSDNNNVATLTLPSPGASGSIAATSAVQISAPAAVAVSGGGGVSWIPPVASSLPNAQNTNLSGSNCISGDLFNINTGSPCIFTENNIPSNPIPTINPNIPTEFNEYVCGRYLASYIKYGQQNDIENVKKLQEFLNTSENEKLAIDGVYDLDDREAVFRFQNKYKDQILAPWNSTKPTGFVGKTTTAKINLMMCAKNKGCPYFKEYLKVGDSSLESVKVQDFLNLIFLPTSDSSSQGIALTKDFNTATYNKVKEFQSVYKEVVLKPWKLKNATGKWYQSTRFVANDLMNCKEASVTLDNGTVLK